MQESQVFEYAVIRVVPRVEREEFLNVGVILFCKRLKYLDVLFSINADRLLAFSPELDLEELQQYLCSFKKICQGGAVGGPIGKLDIAERFRWLTAMRSSVLQTSRVHPGLCEKPSEVLERLFKDLVS